MNWNSITRRCFLRGSGGATLMLPILPSLLSRSGEAQAAASPQKSFIAMAMFNGIANMYNASEAEAKTTPSLYMPAFTNMQTFAGAKHPIHFKTLDAAKTDHGGQISDMFGPEFNPYLSKMLMLQGLDYLPSGSDHHYMHFGAHQGGSPPLAVDRPHMASIDQVMAYSPTFYKNPALIGKSVYFTANSAETGPDFSYTYANPNDKVAGSVVKKNVDYDPAVVWDKFFKGFTKPAQQPAGPTVEQTLVDRTLADYKVFAANPRLGKADKTRLQRHVALLQDTETALKAMPQPGNCTPPARPGVGSYGSQASRTQTLQAMNSVTASLIACGLCHVFAGHTMSLIDSTPDTWHQWSHGNGPAPALANELAQNKAVLKDVVLDLVTKLDQNGLLDNSLVFVPNEHSKRKHECWNTPIVTFGSAGGVLKTGQYIDYRNMTMRDDNTYTRYGYPINQAWANALLATGIPASEFEALNRDSVSPLFNPVTSGYGSTYFHLPYAQQQTNAAYAHMKGLNISDWLPLVNA